MRGIWKAEEALRAGRGRTGRGERQADCPRGPKQSEQISRPFASKMRKAGGRLRRWPGPGGAHPRSQPPAPPQRAESPLPKPRLGGRTAWPSLRPRRRTGGRPAGSRCAWARAPTRVAGRGRAGPRGRQALLETLPEPRVGRTRFLPGAGRGAAPAAIGRAGGRHWLRPPTPLGLKGRSVGAGCPARAAPGGLTRLRNGCAAAVVDTPPLKGGRGGGRTQDL